MASPIHEVHYLLAEALDAIATPEVRDRALARALELAELDEIPAEGRPVRVFVREHLFLAVRELLDEDTAASLVETLTPLMERTTGGEMTGFHATLDPATPFAAEPPGSPTTHGPSAPSLSLGAHEPRRELADLVFVSQNKGRFGRLGRAMGEGVSSARATTGPELLEALREAEAQATVVVVDCVDPAVAPRAVLALDREIPPGLRLLFWGPSPEIELALASRCGRRWRVSGADTSPEDLAGICAAIVRGPLP